MRERVAQFDWASTPLGPQERWPQSLRTLVELCMACRFPMMLWWGPELTYIYNDAYAPILGHRHPEALGRNGQEVWADIWPILKPQIDEVLQHGRATWNKHVKLIMNRTGVPEENWFSWSYCPVYDESGRIAGLYNTCQEETNEELIARDRDRQLERTRQAESRVRSVLESISQAFISLDRSFSFIYVNPQADRMLATQPGELQGRSLFEVLPGVRESAIDACLNRTMHERVPTETVVFYPDHDRWYDVHAYPSSEGVSLVIQDVTEQENARAAIRKSDQRLQQITDATPVYVWACLPDGSVDYYNRRFYEFLAVDPSTPAATIDWANHVHPDDLSRLTQKWAVATRSAQEFQIEFRMRGAKGDYRWLLCRAQPTFDAAGRIDHWYGTATDIEDRRQAESRARFLVTLDEATRPLTDAGEITATHAKLLGEFLQVDRCAYADVEADQNTFNVTGDFNHGVPSIVGRYQFAQFGLEVFARMRQGEPFVCPDVETFEPPLGNLLAYRRTMIRSVVFIPLHKGNRLVAAMAVHQAAPRHWTDDEVALIRQVAGRCWESIERARVERTLRESEARFRSMADAAPVMIWTVDVDGSATWFNKSWLEFTGTTLESQLGSGWLSAVHTDDFERVARSWQDGFDRRVAFDIDYRVRCHSGDFRWILDRGTPRYSAEGMFVGYVGSCTDITDRKRIEEQQQALLAFEQTARREAEQSGRMKDEFLATLSHELRTPLSAILGWSQILGRPGVRPEILEQGLATIERNARAQTQIIEDLLDMSRIVSGKLSLDARPVDLSRIINAAMDTVRAGAVAKSIDLKFEKPSSPVTILGDLNRLQQVFWNLLSNAIKFTPQEGTVSVSITQHNGRWLAEVADTGEGISPAFLPYVFDRFRQADASTTRRHGGLGLGLAIVKQLVELHGGDVAVESAGSGLGSTFKVFLPVHDALAVAVREMETLSEKQFAASNLSDPNGPTWYHSPSNELDGLKILVVDDEPDARVMLQRMLSGCGAVVRVAASVSEAIDCLHASQDDLIVSDIGMPGEDGHALIRKVRASDQKLVAGIPAIALTAYARAEDRVKALRAGFQLHVAKPVEPGELIAAIASLTRQKMG